MRNSFASFQPYTEVDKYTPLVVDGQVIDRSKEIPAHILERSEAARAYVDSLK